MKRYLSILLAAVMLCSCLPALAEGGTHSVSFDRSEAELHVGDELTLTLTQTGGSVEPQYSVSDGTLLEITSGSSGCTVKCLAVGNGTATVTATAGTATATCTLTLKEAQLEPRTMRGLHFTSTPSTLEIGQTYNLQPVEDSGATVSHADITWTYSAAGVVSMWETTIKGESAGQVTVTGTLTDGSSDSCTVTVLAPPAPVEFSISHNATQYLAGEIYPFTAKDAGGNVLSGVTLTSSNTGVVSIDGTNLVTHAGGTATITATLGSVSHSLDVTVSAAPTAISLVDEIEMKVGETYQVQPTLQPSGAATRFSYTVASSNGVISCDGNGKITANKAGTGILRVRTHNGLEDTLYVYVTSATSAYTVSIVNPRIAVSEKTQIVIRGPGGVETAQRYASGNLRVASVDSTGAVIGIGVGTTTITCLLTNGLSYEVSVEVYAYPSSISAYPQSSTIGVGGTTTIVVTSDVPGTFPYTTTSDNTAVVRVDSSDPSLLHGVSAGTATITVTSVNGKKASFQITVSGSAVIGTATVTTSSGSLNLRESASLYSRVIRTIPRGATVDVLSRDTSWSRVRYAGSEGYVLNQYLTFQTSPTPTPGTGTSMARVTTASGSLNLREYASTSARVLVRIPQYAYVTVYSRGTTWCYVSYGGYAGYVMTQYLTFVSDTPTPTPTPGTGTSLARVTTASGSLNLREYASTSARVLVRIPQFSYINVYSRGATWCYVSYGGYAGYVMTEFLTFVSDSPTPAPTGSTSVAQVSTPSGSLNLRAYASTSARVLLQIPEYAFVTVYNRGATWSYVSYNGVSGYVMSVYLSFGGTPVVPTAPPSGGGEILARVTTASGSLNLRESASTGARVLLRIPQNAYVSVYNRGSVWSYVRYNSVYGYVMSQYLTFPGESTPVTPTTPTSGTHLARVTTVAGSLNLREYGSSGSRVLTRIPQYTVISVNYIGTTWCNVSYNGYTGYVMTQYLTLIR